MRDYNSCFKEFTKKVPGVGLEPTRPKGHKILSLACLPIPPSRQKSSKKKSERRGSNPRPRPWQGRALPTELLSLDSLQIGITKVGTFL